jgi:hypothetical protein
MTQGHFKVVTQHIYLINEKYIFELTRTEETSYFKHFP